MAHLEGMRRARVERLLNAGEPAWQSDTIAVVGLAFIESAEARLGLTGRRHA